ncbi:hypothetical protein NMQ01_10965 [Janibacter sp. CX7]|uniref:hypothetical protein n=1 Tax=Janibacter sp. CX7 TaxID=2963431 RepID=UPI0020CC6165|nr:hypothetical protein [Janibacter sp. CX7]UTT65232.1 hypothetical protein NMQ01_10965 [Janibacter sp. CX7]
MSRLSRRIRSAIVGVGVVTLAGGCSQQREEPPPKPSTTVMPTAAPTSSSTTTTPSSSTSSSEITSTPTKAKPTDPTVRVRKGWLSFKIICTYVPDSQMDFTVQNGELMDTFEVDEDWERYNDFGLPLASYRALT